MIIFPSGSGLDRLRIHSQTTLSPSQLSQASTQSSSVKAVVKTARKKGLSSVEAEVERMLTRQKKNKSTNQYLYIILPDEKLGSFVKIGRTCNANGLRKRYLTAYGELTAISVQVDQGNIESLEEYITRCFSLEKDLHDKVRSLYRFFFVM